MPTTELRTFAAYCRSMATSVSRTVIAAREDLVATRIARYPDPTALTTAQHQQVIAELVREQKLWSQLADEIEGYLEIKHAVSHDHQLVDLFTDHAPSTPEQP